MAILDSRSEYESRMHRVLAYIDGHLEQALDLNRLAEVAHFSPFHFHRIFSAWMGETLGDYLRRRRVEVAARRLTAQPRTTIMNLALSVGFSSGEAFTHAFKARFGCSPTVWRDQQALLRGENSKMSQTPEYVFGDDKSSQKQPSEIAMNVILIDRQPANPPPLPTCATLAPMAMPSPGFGKRLMYRGRG